MRAAIFLFHLCSYFISSFFRNKKIKTKIKDRLILLWAATIKERKYEKNERCGGRFSNFQSDQSQLKSMRNEITFGFNFNCFCYRCRCSASSVFINWSTCIHKVENQSLAINFIVTKKWIFSPILWHLIGKMLIFLP